MSLDCSQDAQAGRPDHSGCRTTLKQSTCRRGNAQGNTRWAAWPAIVKAVDYRRGCETGRKAQAVNYCGQVAAHDRVAFAIGAACVQTDPRGAAGDAGCRLARHVTPGIIAVMGCNRA